MPEVDSLVWKRAFVKEFSGKTTPELGSIFIAMPGGFGGVCYGGCRVNVGGKGLVADFSDPSRLFYSTIRKEKESDELPYHNIDYAAAVLCGM